MASKRSHKPAVLRRWPALLSWVLWVGLCAPALGDEPPSSPVVCGELLRVDGARVLRVWGNAHQRGYAHGYLLGPEILGLLEGYLDHIAPDDEGARLYDTKARAILRLMVLRPRFEREMRGMLVGVRDRLGARARVGRLNRLLEYEDILAVNCIPEIARIACSSFAAWGPMTKTGQTITGRNLDWFAIDPLRGRQLIVAYLADVENRRLGWVSVTWPGFIGCLTGLSSEGVSVCLHDVDAGRPTLPLGFSPRALVLRELIESLRPPAWVDEARSLLTRRMSRVGNNVVVSIPFAPGGKEAAAVFEYDGKILLNKGVTVRTVNGAESKKADPAEKCSLVCTNHYRRRAEPEPCGRYDRIAEQLALWAGSGAKIDVAEAWAILRDVARHTPSDERGLETYHSVVFRPNARRMHVAFSTAGASAPENRPVVLDLDLLLRPPAPALAAER